MNLIIQPIQEYLTISLGNIKYLIHMLSGWLVMGIIKKYQLKFIRNKFNLVAVDGHRGIACHDVKMLRVLVHLAAYFCRQRFASIQISCKMDIHVERKCTPPSHSSSFPSGKLQSAMFLDSISLEVTVQLIDRKLLFPSFPVLKTKHSSIAQIYTFTTKQKWDITIECGMKR